MRNVDSIYNSSSRITAMFSDLDTDSLVKSLCSRQQAKIDDQVRKRQLTEWKSTALTDISDKVKTFSNTYCSVLGSSSMLKSATYAKYSVTTSDKSGAVSVETNGDAFEGKISVSVEQLAGNASVAGERGISSGTELSGSNTATLESLAFGTKLTFDSDKKISFKINGKEFSFSSDSTLQSMISTVNADEDADVTLKYSRLTDSFTLSSDSGGAESAVTVENLSGNAFGAGGAFGIAEGTFKNGAQNAVAYIDGMRVERDSNEFTIDDLAYTLNKTTTDDIEFDVKRDFSGTVDAVKDFVKSVNELISTVKGYTTAKNEAADYRPLTDAEKEDMTEEQIEKWEAKAKTGILRHDSALEGLINDIKSAFFSNVGGTGRNLTSIGISTASYFDTNSGLLEVDEEALKTALQKDSDAVINMFTGGTSTVSRDNQGAVYQLRSYLTSYLSMSGDTVKSMNEDVSDIKDEIDDMEDRLANLADKYYDKFATMETALSQLNSTASYMSSLFSN